MSKMWQSALILFLLVLEAQCQEAFIEILQNSSLLITQKCEEQLGEYFANFSINESSWALQMLDATSKIPSGILSLNFGEMGDFNQCINIETTTTNSGLILGKYCLGFISINNAKNDHILLKTSSLGDLDGIKITQVMPMWALCLPNGCSTNDTNVIGNAFFNSVFGQEIGITFTDSFCQTVNEVKPDLTPGAVVTIVILALLFIMAFVSTICDLYCIFYCHKTCPMILQGFSVYSNSQKIFKMTISVSDQLPCLNGLKFISMMWVVAGHQYSIPMNGSITNTKYLMEWANSLYSMFIVSGTLSVDTFFTIGGTLMSYGFMKAKHNKIPFNLFLYYLHRYLRLTAPFALVVLVSATLLKYVGSGPKWPFLEMYFQKNCQDYWWSALLYVQNYVNISEMCVGQTWYLNIDMQLYIISPLVFFALWKYPRVCLPFLSLCVLAFMGVSFFEAWDNQLPAILSNIYGNSNDYQNKYYLLTHTRSGPWVIGVILGFFIYKIKQNEICLRLNKVVVFVLWGVCLGTLFACVLGGHSTLRNKEYDKWGNTIHIALVRPVWSIAISWIILACTVNYGGPINWFLSLPIYQVLNRFTYSIYLTHVTLLYVIAYGKKWPDYFSDFNMAYEFWGTLWISTGLAVLLVFLTESPIIVIEKIIFGNIGKKKKQLKQDLEKGIDNAAFEK